MKTIIVLHTYVMYKYTAFSDFALNNYGYKQKKFISVKIPNNTENNS